MGRKEEGSEQYSFGFLSPQWAELLYKGGWLSTESLETAEQAWHRWNDWQNWTERLLSKFGNIEEMVESAPNEVEQTIAQRRELNLELDWPPGKKSQRVDVEFLSGRTNRGVYFELHLPGTGPGSRKRGLEMLTLFLGLQTNRVREITASHLPWGKFRLIQTSMQTAILDPDLLVLNQLTVNDTFCPDSGTLGNWLIQEMDLKIRRSGRVSGRCRFEASLPCSYGGPLDDINFSPEELVAAPLRILELEPALKHKNRATFTTRMPKPC